jgi:ring-1,2-phenylacetyl-CoA epoxidase subunit PaaE
VITLAIRDVRAATPRARAVRLDLGAHAFSYLAGQALLVAPHGDPVRRPYSIAASPEEAKRLGCLELLVGVDAGGTAGSHLRLEPGARVDVEGPLGSFTFPAHPAERRFVFIAGGTGIAPLRAMLHHALAIPHDGVGVFYSARTPDDFAYEDELRALADAGRIELRQTVTRTVGDDWRGARGRIDRAELQQLVHDPATLCFVCGPPSLVEEMPKLLVELGIPRDRIKIEEW